MNQENCSSNDNHTKMNVIFLSRLGQSLQSKHKNMLTLKKNLKVQSI